MRLPSHPSSQRGNTLLVTLWTLFLIAFGLAVYLRLAVNNNQLAARSQVWNACLPVLEAGIEEALTHCFVNSSNMISNGWTLSNGRCFRTNSLGEGYYEVTVSTNEPFDILSTGYYPMPGSSTYVSRKVKVITQPEPVYALGIVARNGIHFNGNTVRVDSFNSMDPARSTNGRYDPAKAGDHGDVACLNPNGVFDIGNGDIWGHALLAPGGSIQCGVNGSIGSVAWHLAGKNGVEPKWLRTDVNVSLRPITIPFTAAPPPLTKLVSGVLFDQVFDGGNFQLSSLSGASIVTSKSTIFVQGAINSTQLIVKSNATLQIYCMGPSAIFGAISNENQTATSISLIGLPGLTYIELGGNWSGAVYAPNADFSIAGSTEISGSIIVNKVDLRGNAEFHYDEALASTNRQLRAFVVTSWKEL